MVVTLVHIWVKNEFREEFIKETIENHNNSLNEPGNVRFDILQDDNDENKFTLYEVFETAGDIDAHKETQHYLKWREAVEHMMAKPRVGVKHTNIRPIEKELW